MSRAPSEATQIKNLRRDLNELRGELTRTQAAMSTYRTRATKAEQECAEWKERFDILLRRDESKGGGNGDS